MRFRKFLVTRRCYLDAYMHFPEPSLSLSLLSYLPIYLATYRPLPRTHRVQRIYLSVAFTFDERSAIAAICKRTDVVAVVAGKKEERARGSRILSLSTVTRRVMPSRKRIRYTVPYVALRVFIVPVFFLHALQKIIGTAYTSSVGYPAGVGYKT